MELAGIKRYTYVYTLVYLYNLITSKTSSVSFCQYFVNPVGTIPVGNTGNSEEYGMFICGILIRKENSPMFETIDGSTIREEKVYN